MSETGVGELLGHDHTAAGLTLDELTERASQRVGIGDLERGT